MLHKHLRIPTRDSEFNIYQRDVRIYLNAPTGTPPVPIPPSEGSSGGIPGFSPPVGVPKYVVLGVLPAEMAMVNSLGSEWDIVYPLSKEKNTRTPALVETKTDIKTRFESIFHPLLDRMDASPAITIEDRNALHLPLRHAPSPRARIKESPYIKVTPLDDGLFKVRVRVDEDNSRSSINPLADAIEMRFKVGGNAPTSVDECPNSEMSKKAIFFFNTGHNNATKKLWAFFRWVNLSNPSHSGPFGSLVQSVVI